MCQCECIEPVACLCRATYCRHIVAKPRYIPTWCGAVKRSKPSTWRVIYKDPRRNAEDFVDFEADGHEDALLRFKNANWRRLARRNSIFRDAIEIVGVFNFGA